jgi:beta-galactosidase
MIKRVMITGLLGWICGGAAAGPLPAAGPEPAGRPPQLRVEFAREFAPSEGHVSKPQQPWRQELCLNGLWQFQPLAVPAGWQRGEGSPPELPEPKAEGWAPTPLKIPSPWNVNTWGCGRNVGAGTDRPYWPDSVYFPSYPAAWDGVQMGWLRRTFRVPQGWGDRRVVLRFEAVAGDCQVRVNGRLAGSHFDKYLPFELDVTPLVNRDGENELLVGVRAHALFDKQSRRYPKMRIPYPCGSATERLSGIWQDVFLLGLPAVRVQDVFVKPLVDQDTLELEITLRNDGARQQRVRIEGQVHPWMNLAGDDVLSAPDPRWKLGDAALALPVGEVTVKAGETATLVLRERVGGRLKLWAPGAPNLYAAVLAVQQDGRTLDKQFTRFGWRQFGLAGRDLLLNGRRIQLFGDLLHPFGPFTMSRRYVWAWYRLIQDFGGNSVRPHAQIHPRHYLDLADEMGLVVLDETALFGSSIALNFEEPAAWQRFAEHYDGLVLRDRNHPSVVGWSFGNELFAIFNHNNVPKDAVDLWYRQLTELGLRARRLDPTRPWISCDGDEDLRGTLPIWSKHFGHGTPLDRLPDATKPLMVGESGGTYYARPAQMAEFNGPRAFENYEGRNEALAIDVYDNLVRMARPRLAYYSASETAWFGVEHLNFGYRDFTRLPGRGDGVFFTHPFAEGRPGMQPERLPPYVATLNPGWDASLPLYKPLAMFHAQKAALARDAPEPCPWDRRSRPPGPASSAAAEPAVERVAFIGDRAGALAQRLAALGVSLGDAAERGFTVVDADTLTGATVAAAKHAMEDVQAGGGIVLLMMGGREAGGPIETLLSAQVRFTERPATALTPDARHPWTAPLALPDLYFAEDGPNRFIMRRGLDGPLPDRGRVLLKASNTDWSLFNDAPEHAKCAAVVLYEHMVKPSGAALVECDYGKGKLVLCTLDHRVATRSADAFWRRLLANMGLKLGLPREGAVAAFDDEGALLNALSIGRFGAPALDAASTTDFIGETTARPVNGAVAGGLSWRPVDCPSRDRFLLGRMNQAGPQQEPFAVYFSYWIRSPRGLDDLLAGGPDAPRFTTLCYASEKCRLFLNGRELTPARTEPADYRTLYVFDNIPLMKDWNHFLVKVVAGRLQDDRPATLAVRINSGNKDYFRQLDSAIELKPSAAASEGR